MFYYKKDSTYIASHTELSSAEKISKEEYECVKGIVDNRPIAPEGYAYRLNNEMEWELYDLPVYDEVTDAEALDIILGGAM